MNLKKHAITRDHAAGVVKSAPGQLGQEYIIDHVHKALAEAYEKGRSAGGLEARETILRSELAFWEGYLWALDKRLRRDVAKLATGEAYPKAVDAEQTEK